jgi:deaminated glutathione amidase
MQDPYQESFRSWRKGWSKRLKLCSLSQYIYLQALFLPEASDYIASSPAETVSLVRSVEDSPFVRGIQEEAKAYSLAVNVGIHEPTISGKKVKNTSIWINENGEITQRYQKIHLFDVEIKNGPVLKESNSVEKGTSILPPFNTSLGRVGLTICFDVRAIIYQNASSLVRPLTSR